MAGLLLLHALHEAPLRIRLPQAQHAPLRHRQPLALEGRAAPNNLRFFKLSRGYDEIAVKQQFRKLATRFHPDKCDDEDALERFQECEFLSISR